jgi:hypothetical protein
MKGVGLMKKTWWPGHFMKFISKNISLEDVAEGTSKSPSLPNVFTQQDVLCFNHVFHAITFPEQANRITARPLEWVV